MQEFNSISQNRKNIFFIVLRHSKPVNLVFAGFFLFFSRFIRSLTGFSVSFSRSPLTVVGRTLGRIDPQTTEHCISGGELGAVIEMGVNVCRR